MGHNYPVRRTELTWERANELLRYDAETGYLYWIYRHYRVKPGARAGYLHKHDGYRYVTVDHVSYPEHRVIWLLVTGKWPDHWIDHTNENRSDNRFENLREATPAQNNAYKRKTSRNKSGRKGVRKSQTPGKWTASISYQNQDVYLGTYDCPDKAALAYELAAERLYKDFARSD